MNFAANLSFLWAELPYFDRFAAAADAGFEAVEILFPYDVAVKETQRALLANGLKMILLNAPPPNYTGGARGFAAQPEQVERFRRDIVRSFRYAEALGVSFIHVMTGAAEGQEATDTLLENLVWACDCAPDGITLTLEPLNNEAQPGYYLNDYELAAEIIAAVDAPNIGLQYDSYHAQVIHADAVGVFEAFRPLIRHIQIGDTPTRGAPGTGDVDFAGLFDSIAASGYDGHISGEYNTEGQTDATLGWMKGR